MFRRYALCFCLALGFGLPVLAQDSTEPPPPVAAPRVSVMAEELPRVGAVVVFGADQPLGREMVKALAAANKQVMAVLPEGADRTPFAGLKVAVVSADPLAPDQLKTLFTSAPVRAIVTAFDTAGERPAFGIDGTRNIIDATKATNLPRLVLVSATGAGDSVALLPWYVKFLRGEAIAAAGTAEAYLKASGLDYTIVRAGWIIGEDATGAAAAALQDTAPVFSWIVPADLARLVAGLVDTKAASGKTTTALDSERTSLFSVIF
ncbi:MAG: SDR family oxidoreductase [Proteobacteria bacterium]|nr:SDR family oxidoreductase [Pseudomonadota bacterium]